MQSGNTAAPLRMVELRNIEIFDIPEIRRIHRLCFESITSEAELMTELAAPNRCCIALDEPAPRLTLSMRGFLVFAHTPNVLTITAMAVSPEYQRAGYGAMLVGHLMHALAEGTWSRIEAYVRESNDRGALFLQRLGFRAARLIPGHFANPVEDAYRMVYRKPAVVKPVVRPADDACGEEGGS